MVSEVAYAMADTIDLWTPGVVAILVGVIIMALLIVYDLYSGD